MKPIFHLLPGLVLAAALSFTPAQAADPEVIETTTISLRGKPHYPPDFTHFAYTNPDAAGWHDCGLDTRHLR